MDRKKINKNGRKFVQLTSIPFEMFIIIFAGYKLGAWLDTKYPNDMALYTLIATLSAVFLAMFRVIWRVRKIS